jgi:hypothetical protein
VVGAGCKLTKRFEGGAIEPRRSRPGLRGRSSSPYRVCALWSFILKPGSFRLARYPGLRCVRVLDPIPMNRAASSLSRDDSGLLTSVRTDEARFVNLSSQATIRCASAASGHTRALPKCARVARHLSRAATVIDVHGRGTFSSFVAARRTMSYSCRRAASGSIRDARLAGA